MHTAEQIAVSTMVTAITITGHVDDHLYGHVYGRARRRHDGEVIAIIVGISHPRSTAPGPPREQD